MKVVYNTKGFGLRLNEQEMRMFCALLGYTLRSHSKPISSENTWFKEVDWQEFRAEPLLVRLVEEGMLSNEDLAVHEWDEYDPYYHPENLWHIDTDYRTHECVWVAEQDSWEVEDWEREYETEGATA